MAYCIDDPSTHFLYDIVYQHQIKIVIHIHAFQFGPTAYIIHCMPVPKSIHMDNAISAFGIRAQSFTPSVLTGIICPFHIE